MIFEIEKAGYQLTHQVWTNPHIKYKSFQGFNYFVPSLGWSSGPSALHLASIHKPLEIFILGFDYTGLEGNFNNVYADTENYKKSSDVATYFGNWEKQTEHVIKNNQDIKYYRVVEEDFYNPKWNYTNFRHLTYKDFKKMLGLKDKS